MDYRGYKLTDITMVPRPKHLPVDIWMPIASGKTIDMMAKYGLKPMVVLNGEKILDDVIRAYHDACARHGQQKQLGQDMVGGAGLGIRSSGSGRSDKAGRAGARRTLQVVGAVRLRALRRRAWPHLGHASRRRAHRRCKTACSRRRGSAVAPAR